MPLLLSASGQRAAAFRTGSGRNSVTVDGELNAAPEQWRSAAGYGSAPSSSPTWVSGRLSDCWMLINSCTMHMQLLLLIVLRLFLGRKLLSGLIGPGGISSPAPGL